ncbi:MAG: hypothetical protein IPJ20_19335 [Flammeovirgaceae bacterium]|nr:hypothetical protein [Flammeovirgaceae bacterium]
MKWELYQESEPKEKYLYRFLSKEHLEKYLNSGSIWMARSDQFGDKMECVTIKDLSKGTSNI